MILVAHCSFSASASQNFHAQPFIIRQIKCSRRCVHFLQLLRIVADCMVLSNTKHNTQYTRAFCILIDFSISFDHFFCHSLSCAQAHTLVCLLWATAIQFAAMCFQLKMPVIEFHVKKSGKKEKNDSTEQFYQYVESKSIGFCLIH